MPGCREWDLTKSVLFQVLDGEGPATAVTLAVDDIDHERARLSAVGIEVGPASPVRGFDTLRFVRFTDPEGNEVGLLDGH